MVACCHAEEYSELFGARQSRFRAWRFDHLGLHGSAADAADLAGVGGGPDDHLLEVGGGLGEIPVVVLDDDRAGSATNVELSRGWEDAAGQLLARRGLQDRVTRRLGDVVDDCEELPPADVVVAHRVLCCYPHWERMVDALAALARRRVVITLPVDRARTRVAIGVGNRLLASRGRDFRAHVHPVGDVLDRFAASGWEAVADTSGLAWRTIALERT